MARKNDDNHEPEGTDDSRETDATESAAPSSDWFDLARLVAEGGRSIFDYGSYRRALQGSWSDAGAYFLFLVGVLTIVQFFFGIFEINRYFRSLEPIVQQVPTIEIRPDGYTLPNHTLPYQFEHDGLTFRFDPSVRAAPTDLNVPMVIMGGSRLYMNVPLMGPQYAGISFADANLTVTPDWLFNRLEDIRREQISQSLIINLFSLAFMVALAAGVLAGALLGLGLSLGMPYGFEAMAFVTLRGVTLPMLLVAFLPMRVVMTVPPIIFLGGFLLLGGVQSFLGLRAAHAAIEAESDGTLPEASDTLEPDDEGS